MKCPSCKKEVSILVKHRELPGFKNPQLLEMCRKCKKTIEYTEDYFQDDNGNPDPGYEDKYG